MLIFGNVIVPHCFKVRLIMLGCFTLSVYSDHSSTVKMVQLFEKYIISWKSLYNFVSVLYMQTMCWFIQSFDNDDTCTFMALGLYHNVDFTSLEQCIHDKYIFTGMDITCLYTSF